MAMSIDALLAVVLFIALVAFISLEPVSEIPITQPRIAVNQLVDDAVAAMDSTGFIMQSIENGQPEDINAKMMELLPERVEFKIKMLRYSSDIDDLGSNCRSGQTFESCFPNPYPGTEPNPTTFLESPETIPSDREVFHGKKLFVKREPGDCEFETGLRAKTEVKRQLLFQGTGDGNFNFGSSVQSPPGTEVTELQCDQEAYVELSISRKTKERLPVDIVFAAAKNRSMGECAIAAGNDFFTYSESQTRSDFEKVTDFTVSNANAIDVILSWTSCSANCPEFYISSPSDTNYGSLQVTTEQDSTECNVHNKATQSGKAYYYGNRVYLRYLALGSGLVETGSWGLYVKNPNGVSYNVEAKDIDNNHFNDSAPDLIEAWNEPIAKVEIAKVMITEFTQRAEWSVNGPDWNHDQYAYGEIGDPTTNPQIGSSIQPASEFRDAGDIGPPISSQLKNLDSATQNIDAPAYAFALDDDDLINDALANNFPDYNRTKFAIIYGDSLDDSGSYTIANAIADAQDKGLYYYTIDFNENNWGQSLCQNQDLRDLADQTGGKCYPATDEGALGAILDIIAKEIGDKAAFGPEPGSATLTMTFPSDFQASFLYDFSPQPDVWDGQTLEYQNVTITSVSWTPEFYMNIPCNFAGCDSFLFEDRNVLLPPLATTMSYTIDGQPEQVNWPTEDIKTIPIKFTDLLIQFIGGQFYGIHDVTIYYRVLNDGYFDVDLADVVPTNFYQGTSSLDACPDDGGTWIDNHDLAGYGILEAAHGNGGTTTSVDLSKALSESGYLCIYINEPPSPDTRTIQECSENNWVVVNCDVPKTFVYSLEYWMWYK